MNSHIGRDDRLVEREQMILQQVADRGIRNAAILDALRAVPREWFVSDAFISRAYHDEALQSDCGQTISQPYMVGYMTDLLEPAADKRILEIGTGTGYQTAVLAQLVARVYTIEWYLKLMQVAADRLERLNIRNVTYRCGDGSQGWAEEAPFDGILVTAGGPDVPAALTDQLAPGGILVMPVGNQTDQTLVRIRRAGRTLEREDALGCRFVRLRGRFGWDAQPV